MTRKFEQDNKSYVNYMVYKKKAERMPVGRVALENWAEVVQTSAWATRTDDAHSKYMGMYSNEME